MSTPKNREKSSSTRRDFLKQSGGLLAAAAATGALGSRGYAYAGEDNTLKLALVGCGGRGTGAVSQAMSTQGPTKLVAMADFFEHRLESSLKAITPRHAKQIDVPKERRFIGLDAYKHAIDAVSPGGVVLLATPPAFRPLHVEYAVSKGCHVFMEKSFAVDGPGVRRILQAGQVAQQKNLKIAGGLMSRHCIQTEQAIEQIHSGAIGDVITCWSYREHGPVGFTPKSPGMSEMAHQIRNYSNYTWLNGSFLLDWLIHNLDVACWAKNAWPVSAQAQGGRQVRTEPDQLFDHYMVEYSYPDGTRMVAQGRHIPNCWGFWGVIVHGASGSAILGEGIPHPRIFKSCKQTPENIKWQYKGELGQQYQVEHDLLSAAIRQDKPYNESERCAYAALTGILGRMACESGKEITWEQALNSNAELAPGIDKWTMDSDPPVKPDANGRYPIAMPGFTSVL